MTITYHRKTETTTPDPELTFAEQAAAAEFGRHYVPPVDRNFEDRPPPGSQRPDDVDQDAVDEIGRYRIAQLSARVPV